MYKFLRKIFLPERGVWSMDNKPSGKNMILAASILLLIGGVVTFLSSIVGIAMGGLFASEKDTAGASTLAVLFLVYFITVFLMSIFEIVASIYGIANRNKPQKAKTCLVMGIILVLIAILNILLSFYLGNFGFSLILSLILPLLYMGGALMNRPAHNE